MRNHITLSVMRICGFALLAALLVLIIPTTSYAEEHEDECNDLHTLEPGGRDATILTGRAQDIWSIDLRECPTSLDLHIVDIHDYSEDDGWSPDAEDVYYDWHASASAGRWQWVQPTDYQWVLLVSNPNRLESSEFKLDVHKIEEPEKEGEKDVETNLFVLLGWIILMIMLNVFFLLVVLRNQPDASGAQNGK